MEGEVESQRQQRLSDAKQVEAKAARIKVTMIILMTVMMTMTMIANNVRIFKMIHCSPLL